MIYELLVPGTIWFWAFIVLVSSVWMFYVNSGYCEDRCRRGSHGKFPIEFAIVAIALYCLFGNLHELVKWVILHPVYAALVPIGYLAIGWLYAFTPYVGRWTLLVGELKERNEQEKIDWLSRIVSSDIIPGSTHTSEYAKICQGVKDSGGKMTPEALPFWKNYEQANGIKKPSSDDFIDYHISWMVNWPAFILWSLIEDPISYLGRKIILFSDNWISGTINSIWGEDEIVETGHGD